MSWHANCSLSVSIRGSKSVPNNSSISNQRSGKCVRPKAIRGEERELTCMFCCWLFRSQNQQAYLALIRINSVIKCFRNFQTACSVKDFLSNKL